MNITEITADDIILDLDRREHLALSDAFCLLMSTLEPSAIEAVLGWTAEQAYEFGYSVYVDEAIARLDGNTWLKAPACSDRLAVDAGARPVVWISFSEAGSSWHLNARQARFVARCMKVARRLETLGTADADRDERVFHLVA
ncbi:MAG: hypothetical protein ACOH10_14620 [Rhodoglobus sp.]